MFAYTIPAKPKKDRLTMPAAIKVMGSPFKNSGTLDFSSLVLTPAKIIIASIKPRPAPSAFAKDSIKL